MLGADLFNYARKMLFTCFLTHGTKFFWVEMLATQGLFITLCLVHEEAATMITKRRIILNNLIEKTITLFRIYHIYSNLFQFSMTKFIFFTRFAWTCFISANLVPRVFIILVEIFVLHKRSSCLISAVNTSRIGSG